MALISSPLSGSGNEREALRRLSGGLQEDLAEVPPLGRPESRFARHAHAADQAGQFQIHVGVRFV